MNSNSNGKGSSKGKALVNDTGESVRRQVTYLNTIMGAVVLVTFFGFIAMVVTVMGLAITYQHDNAQSYRDYRDEIRLQNDKIDTLTTELKARESTAPTPPPQ